ncbi:RHS repeat-associated core domain-containing protein [Pantoea sp. Ap-967]|uniref:RHS repeat-associated core domain-containing protein n=1 Tax=Pantoea sp. Ap-967 TaxID=2608362 RepID=UPI001420C064|nr:RHS repeat-associated core domain-containing protein [Pantoea sp. Ap-967]NIE77080.1 RHS repeat-associated core domain-containing protein [Pantoea sp. Ap-967]
MNKFRSCSYTPYGFTPIAHPTQIELGFNGEPRQALTSLYILGAGYRIFSPNLHRFYSADNYSPFADGGLNAYCYCLNDPINSTDPTGHIPYGLKRIFYSKETLANYSKVRIQNKYQAIASLQERTLRKYHNIDSSLDLEARNAFNLTDQGINTLNKSIVKNTNRLNKLGTSAPARSVEQIGRQNIYNAKKPSQQKRSYNPPPSRSGPRKTPWDSMGLTEDEYNNYNSSKISFRLPGTSGNIEESNKELRSRVK